MILDEILKHKRREVAEARRRAPVADVRARAGDAPPPRDFRGALSDRPDVALIAEIKKASPSAGLICADFDPALIASSYHTAGAAALSVLTDRRFFGGEPGFIALAKAAAPLPALCKDFIIDACQVYEARAAGADAVLLIARILSDTELADLLGLVHELGMAALVEAHNAAEVARAVRSGAPILGINNRDLDTLGVDLATTETLAASVPPDRVLVSESGVASRSDVERLAASGVDAVLVGEALMKNRDVVHAAQQLVGVRRLVR